MDGGAWWAAVHGVSKSQTRLSDFTFTFHFHALEKEMATRSSVLAWRIPRMGEPGGLPSMGSHRSHSQTRLKRLSSSSSSNSPLCVCVCVCVCVCDITCIHLSVDRHRLFTNLGCCKSCCNEHRSAW